MMNLVAISLIATSFVASALFSPNPQNNAAKEEQVIVKGGHRAVVVEYGDDIGDGNTKVSISSQHPTKGPIEEQLSQAAASVAGVAQDVKGTAQEVVTGQNGPHGARPRELICDAYGRCKHKISEVWSKAKGKASEAEEAVEEVVEEVVDKAKGLASMAGGKAEESAEGVKENAKEKVREAGKTAERVREKTGEKVRETGEMARDKVEEIKGKTGEKMRETGEMARESVDKVKEKTGEIVEETGEKIKKGKRELSDITRRGKEVVFYAIWYICSFGYNLVKETLSSMMNVMHLLGFSIAYGISIWVTFINSHVLAGVLPRQQFGMVQSKIYPVYFKAMVGNIGLALLGQLLGQRGKAFRNKADMLQGYNLLTSLVLVLGNLLFLEPRATRVMFNRMKLEKEEGRGRDRGTAPTRVMDTVVGDSAGPIPTTTAATTTDTTTVPTVATTTTTVGRSEDEAKTKLAKLDSRLKKLNSYSSFLNIMTLMSLTWHLVYLSQRLRANC